MKSEIQYLTFAELRRFYGISPQAVYRALEYGHPPMVKGEGFDLLESCRWFAARERDGKAKARATEYLASRGAKIENVKRTGVVLPISPGKLGIAAAVDCLKNAEEMLHDLWEKARETKAADARKRFRKWQYALELLNRAEPMLVKYHNEMGNLSETSKIAAWLKRMIKRAESALTPLPAEMAKQCEGLPWPQIQKLLEGEMRRVLETIAAIP